MAAALNKTAAVQAATKEFLAFVNEAVTPFHCVEKVSSMLSADGFQGLQENAVWPALTPGGKYFVTRNDSTIIAFTVGGKYVPGNGVKIVGAHTDSPNLALKPKTFSKRGQYQGVASQLYGGGLWHTWFDRDLTVAGRVVLQQKGSSRITTKLVNLKKPILRIPTLAIHLTSAAEREAFAPNKESHVAPVSGTHLMATANAEVDRLNDHNAGLMRLIADSCGVAIEEILDFDLSIIDTQPSAVGGIYDEFIFSPRLDNQVSCFCAVRALLDASDTVDADTMVRMVALFDHEEVGSSSSPGAAGSVLPDIIERLHANDAALRTTGIANSFALSVDGVHACHPNYEAKHEAEHRPALHEGPAVKYNANQRYATTGVTAAVVRSLAKLCDVPLQQTCVKNDSPCGSTIGPIVSTLTGVATVDLGGPMLSMHSVREMCGTVDCFYLTTLIKTFFDRYQDVRA
jgi:aspartyl aminopeptidase